MGSAEQDHFVADFKGASAARDGEVRVEVDIDIIRQMSLQLYTNPRKAIEELVSNSYDAGADDCLISTPRGETDHLVVLDNGSGMNVEGLQALWRVAKSPKSREDGDGGIEYNRKLIGKFGVGKLAAFSLGRRVVHLTNAEGRTRIVSIGLSDIAQRSEEGHADEPFPVFALPEKQARPIVAPHLKELPKPWEQPGNKWKNWTAAIVHEIEPRHFTTRKKTLRPDLIRKMIAASIPITDEFHVTIDGEPIKPRAPDRKEKGLIREIRVEDPSAIKAIRGRLRSFYKEELGLPSESDVPPSLLDVTRVVVGETSNLRLRTPAIFVPSLGEVSGLARGYEHILTSPAMEERGYADHGFAVRVRGKLVNTEDHTFGLGRPLTYKYFNRFFAEIEVPSLDQDLLVQRNSVNEESERAELTRQVLIALFYLMRPIIEGKIEPAETEERGIGWLRRASLQTPNRFRLALAGLAGEAIDLSKISFVAESRGPSLPAVTYESERDAFVINPDHPLLRAIDEELTPQCKKVVLPVLHELLAAYLALLGYLRERKVDADLITDSVEFLDDLLVAVSSSVADEFTRHIKELEATSFQGDKAFELALVAAFEGLGLTARHLGGPGKPDGILTIKRGGERNLRISVEAKGGLTEPKDHSSVPIADIDRHRVSKECDNAVVIARSFQEDGLPGTAESALLTNSKATAPPVVLIPLSAVKKMIERHREAGFSRPMIQDILTTWKKPSEMTGNVEQVWKSLPATKIQIREILETAEQMMEDRNLDHASVSALSDRERLRNKVSEAELWRIISSLSVLTPYVTIVDETKQTFRLEADPEIVLRYLDEKPR